MEEFMLIDIKPKSSLFTWLNRRMETSFMAKKLDRFLVSRKLVSWLQGYDSKTLINKILDHKMVSLELFSLSRENNTPYKFNPVMIKEKDFLRKV